jgi:hypothetical protein
VGHLSGPRTHTGYLGEQWDYDYINRKIITFNLNQKCNLELSLYYSLLLWQLALPHGSFDKRQDVTSNGNEVQQIDTNEDLIHFFEEHAK